MLETTVRFMTLFAFLVEEQKKGERFIVTKKGNYSRAGYPDIVGTEATETLPTSTNSPSSSNTSPLDLTTKNGEFRLTVYPVQGLFLSNLPSKTDVL
jgi:hypothetical protein